MTEALWGERQPPPVPAVAAPLGDWELSAPADLASCRARLRIAFASRPRPLGADPDAIDRLQLVFEELASNGLRHGRFPVRVRIVPTGDGWLVDATDAAIDLYPTPAVDRDPARGGLGLYLIARLCTAHGWTVRDDRKHVWACLRSA